MTSQVVVPGPGEQVPRLNSKVIDSFIFNRGKLHQNALSDDIININSSGVVGAVLPPPPPSDNFSGALKFKGLKVFSLSTNSKIIVILAFL